MDIYTHVTSGVPPETPGSRFLQVQPGDVAGARLAGCLAQGLAAVKSPGRTGNSQCCALRMSQTTLTRKRGEEGGTLVSRRDTQGRMRDRAPERRFGRPVKVEVNSAWSRLDAEAQGRRAGPLPSLSLPDGDVGTCRPQRGRQESWL